MSDEDITKADRKAAPIPPRQRRGWRRLVVCMEVVVLVLLLPVIAAIIAVFLASGDRLRLPQGVETRITAAIDQAVPSHAITIREMEVELPEGRFTPEIVLQGVEIRESGALRAFLPEVSVVLNGWALTKGEFRPRRVQLDGAGLHFARDADGIIDLSVATGSASETLGITETLAQVDAVFSEPAFSELTEISGTSLVLLLTDEMTGQLIQSQDAEMRLEQKGEALTLRLTGSVAASRSARVELAVTRNPALERNDILFAFENIATEDLATASPALQWLGLLRAPMSGRLVGIVADDGRVGDMRAELDIGAGNFVAREGLDPIPLDAMRAALSFDAEGSHILFEELSIASEPLNFTATGRADVFENGRELVGQLRFSDLRAAPEGLFTAPLVFEGGALDMRLSFQPEFDLQIGQAVLYDGPLRIRAWGQVVAQEDGLMTRIDARIPELQATDLYPYWPAFIIPGTRDWVTENLSTGLIENLAASYRSGQGEPQVGIRFDFSDLTLRALEEMPEITEASGYLSVLNEDFALHLTQAQVEAPSGGTIDLSGSSMLIPDARPRNPEARFDLAIDGPLEAVGALLAVPPVRLLEGSPLDPATLATGWAQADVGLDLTFRREIPREDIQFQAQGVLTDVSTGNLIPDKTLTAQSLDLTVTSDSVAIAGRAELDGVPLTGRWSQNLTGGEGSRAEGRMTVNADTLATLGLTLPDGMVTGSGGADFALSIPRGAAPDLRVSSDLSGIGLTLPGLPWRLTPDQTGRFSTRVLLGETPDVPELTLDAAGLDLSAAIALAAGGRFERLEIERGRIDDWADITGTLWPGRLSLSGGSLDLRELGGDTGGGGALAIDARLDRLILTEGIALTDLRTDLTPSLSGPFRGLVNGRAEIAGQLTRGEAGLSIDISAADAGAILRAADLFDNGYGGQMTLALRPTGARGAYDGRLDITGTRLRDAPAMAELLNAISVVGLLEQLGGEGINLGELEADFRIRPGAIILDEGSAVGPSMGISMDGVYETGPGRFDMQGVISPVYIVNGFAGALFAPRREGLFGFTYQLTGSPSGSQVTVNPLSILTPGIFREIFRRPPPEIATQ